jgi:hypothetical protein
MHALGKSHYQRRVRVGLGRVVAMDIRGRTTRFGASLARARALGSKFSCGAFLLCTGVCASLSVLKGVSTPRNVLGPRRAGSDLITNYYLEL